MSFELQDPYSRSFKGPLTAAILAAAGTAGVEMKVSQQTAADRDWRGEITGILICEGPVPPIGLITADIDGVLWDDTDSCRKVFTLLVGIPHKLRFKHIWGAGTTATKIIILGSK